MPIFDQGYQHWNGELAGHAWRWLAIARHGVRVGLKNRFVRVLLLVSWLPAAALALVLCLWGYFEHQTVSLDRQSTNFTWLAQMVLLMIGRQAVLDPRHYRMEVWTISYSVFHSIELWLAMILIFLIGPNLISQDLRFNALPLYFSRPLRRIDYFLGKLGIIATFLGMVTIVPCLIAYGFGLLFSLDFSIVRQTFGLLVASLIYGSVVTLSAGALVLALSSLSRNSRYIALAWLAIWFVSGILATILHNVNHEQHTRFQRNAAFREVRQSYPTTGTAQEQMAWQSRQRMVIQQVQQRLAEEELAEEARTATTDWRPMISYAANLRRIGDRLLGTNTAWIKLSEIQPAETRARFLLATMGPEYPWYWSAGLLAGLFLLSALVLNFRVKSLDRLK